MVGVPRQTTVAPPLVAVPRQTTGGGGGVLWGVLKSQIPNYYTP